MNRLLILALVPSLALAAPKHTTPTPTPTPGPNGEMAKGTLVCLPKQKWLELVDWFNGLHAENVKAQTDLAAALKSNTTTKSQLDASVLAATALANECAADKACARAPLTCWFHRLLKHILWIGAALIVVLILVTIFAPGAMKLIMSVLNFIWSWIAAIFKPRPPAP